MEMYCTDHYGSEEYPFHGIFYKVEIDDSKPLDEQVDEEIPIFETDMDMSDGGTLSTIPLGCISLSNRGKSLYLSKRETFSKVSSMVWSNEVE